MSQNPQQLLADVNAAPDDDRPREAYADFFAPYEPDRSDLIRIQLARARDERARRAARGYPDARETQLLLKHGEEWARYLHKYLVPSPSDPSDRGWGFERGFVAFARLAIENVVGLGARLYELAPIQHLDVAPGDGPPGRVLRAAGLDKLDSISLAGLGLGDDDAVELAKTSALSRTTWVDLSSNKIGRRGVEALASSPIFANKVRVLLTRNPFDPVDDPAFDWDGSVADVSSPGDPAELEAKLGPVRWFHYPWRKRSEEPDRFHARSAGRPD